MKKKWEITWMLKLFKGFLALLKDRPTPEYKTILNIVPWYTEGKTHGGVIFGGGVGKMAGHFNRSRHGEDSTSYSLLQPEP